MKPGPMRQDSGWIPDQVVTGGLTIAGVEVTIDRLGSVSGLDKDEDTHGSQ